MSRYSQVLVGLCLQTLAFGLHAAEPTKSGLQTPPPMAANVSYLEAVGGLVLVVLLILLLGWAVKRLGITPANRGTVRIIGGVSLGGRERALVLEAEGKRVLVGVAPGQVRPLLQLGAVTDSASLDEGFADQLQQQLQSAAGSGSGAKQPPKNAPEE